MVIGLWKKILDDCDFSRELLQWQRVLLELSPDSLAPASSGVFSVA